MCPGNSCDIDPNVNQVYYKEWKKTGRGTYEDYVKWKQTGIGTFILYDIWKKTGIGTFEDYVEWRKDQIGLYSDYVEWKQIGIGQYKEYLACKDLELEQSYAELYQEWIELGSKGLFSDYLIWKDGNYREDYLSYYSEWEDYSELKKYSGINFKAYLSWAKSRRGSFDDYFEWCKHSDSLTGTDYDSYERCYDEWSSLGYENYPFYRFIDDVTPR